MARRSQSSLTHWAARSGMGDFYEYGNAGDGDWYYDPATGEVIYDPVGGGGGSLVTPWDTTYAPFAPAPGGGDTGNGWTDFWTWFGGGFPSGGAIFDPNWQPPFPDFNLPPIDFLLPSFAGPTHVAVCGKGTYVDPNDVTRCIPFPPAATEAQKKALQQQGNQAAQRAQQAQKQQQALQQAAQQCAAKGGRVTQGADGKLYCQLPNGTQQTLETGSFPMWLLLLLGIVVLTR